MIIRSDDWNEKALVVKLCSLLYTHYNPRLPSAERLQSPTLARFNYYVHAIVFAVQAATLSGMHGLKSSRVYRMQGMGIARDLRSVKSPTAPCSPFTQRPPVPLVLENDVPDILLARFNTV